MFRHHENNENEYRTQTGRDSRKFENKNFDPLFSVNRYSTKLFLFFFFLYKYGRNISRFAYIFY